MMYQYQLCSWVAKNSKFETFWLFWFEVSRISAFATNRPILGQFRSIPALRYYWCAQ